MIVFFLQAEVGIRDRTVTGVQTCALPILELWASGINNARVMTWGDRGTLFVSSRVAGNVYAVTDKGGSREVKTIAKGLNQIGRASCRERVERSAVAVALEDTIGEVGDRSE